MTTSKTLLFHTIGNRDLQFKPHAVIPLKYLNYLERNNENDDTSNQIIKKSADKSFREISEWVLEDFEMLKEWLDFPILQAAINYVNKTENKTIQELVLCTTAQMNPNATRQDCDIVGEVMKKQYNNSFFKFTNKVQVSAVNILPINIAPKDSNVSALLDFFSTHFQTYSQEYDAIFISNKAGPPIMAEASAFAGMFKGFKFITVHPKYGASLKSYAKYEEILRQNFESNTI